MLEYTRGAPFETNALRHFQDYLCLPSTILSASLAYEFSQNHPDTGPSPEGRSIGHVRDKSAPTGGWMILLICFSWPISYMYLAMFFIKVLFLLCDFIASLKKIAFLSILFDALNLAFYQVAMFCREKPGCRVPFTCIGIVVENLDAIGVEDLGEGEIS